MPRIKVLDTFAIPVEKYDMLNGLGTLSIYSDVAERAEDILMRAEGGDVLVLNKTRITGEIISKLDKVKLIAETASGYDNIDVKAAAAEGITVCNAPGYSTDSVAELVFAMLLGMKRKIRDCAKRIEEGEWLAGPLIGEEIAGSAIGIVGFGSIGKAVARIALGFSMKTSAFTRNPEKYAEAFPDVGFTGLDELLQRSDIVTLHVPHTHETEQLISRERLEMMKKGAVLINCARGRVVDQDALAEICEQGRLYACLDVLNTEGIEKDNRLAVCPNVMITPHVGWYTDQALDRLVRTTYENIAAYFTGSPRNTVG